MPFLDPPASGRGPGRTSTATEFSLRAHSLRTDRPSTGLDEPNIPNGFGIKSLASKALQTSNELLRTFASPTS